MHDTDRLLSIESLSLVKEPLLANNLWLIKRMWLDKGLVKGLGLKVKGAWRVNGQWLKIERPWLIDTGPMIIIDDILLLLFLIYLVFIKGNRISLSNSSSSIIKPLFKPLFKKTIKYFNAFWSLFGKRLEIYL